MSYRCDTMCKHLISTLHGSSEERFFVHYCTKYHDNLGVNMIRCEECKEKELMFAEPNMTKIVVKVPGGDKCTGCDFIVTSTVGRDEIVSCSIFKTKIEQEKKCVGCKNCSKE